MEGTIEATLCAVLAGWFSDSEAVWRGAAPVDPQALIELAIRTRTLGLLVIPSHVEANGWEAVATKVLAYRDQATRLNLRQLNQLNELGGTLRREKISTAVIKGVLRLKQVYGRIDLRMSTDIDLLVPRSRYNRAIELLCSLGYHPGVPSDSVWWHHYLGESPHIRVCERGSGAVVDLHHRLQQPGASAPRDLDAFLRSASVVAGANLPLPSATFGLLVTVINFSKGLRNREPWVTYAHEIVLQWRKMSSAEHQAFLALASDQRLGRMAAAAIGSSHAIFGLGSPRELPFLEAAADTRLLRLSACGLVHRGYFRRSRLAWRWTDGSGVSRALRYTLQMATFHASERARRRESHRT